MTPVTASDASQRAKGRWAILRNALMSRSRGDSQEDEPSIRYSIHKFAGFQMLHRNELSNAESKLLSERCNVDVIPATHVIFEYNLPVMSKILGTNFEPILKVRTTERKIVKPDIKELISHQVYGVDNTGNTRVWDSSNVLAYLIMSEKKLVRHSTEMAKRNNDEDDFYSDNVPFIGLEDILSLASCKTVAEPQEKLRVLELGAGMAGLPALSLLSLESFRCKEKLDNIPKIEVCLSDGHPLCVENNKICAKLTHSLGHACCEKLLWKSDEEGLKECESLLTDIDDIYDTPEERKSCKFDLILVSDCTHFIDFHTDLAATIGRLLRIQGRCMMLQPHRGKSLMKFIRIAESINYGKKSCSGPLFKIDLHDMFNEKIHDMHKKYVVQLENVYDPNIHRPLLLTLTKLRHFEEIIEGNCTS